jgi:hypothetical protein
MSARQVKYAFDPAESEYLRNHAMVLSQKIARMTGKSRFDAARALRDRMMNAGIPSSNLYLKNLNSLLFNQFQETAAYSTPKAWNEVNAADRGLFY